MRAVLQRVTEASVTVEGQVVGQIGHGLLILLGIGAGDDAATAAQLAEKIANLRIFADAQGRFNRSAIEAGAAALVVSQFTLYADTRRGRRPGFSAAAAPAPLVDAFAAALHAHGLEIAQGMFGRHMAVALVNDGPVTIILDSSTLREPGAAQ
jgi:D-tyrosyl-tRNA(Tyr) deacylase